MSHEIRTPIPGIFYRRPAPEQDPFVDIGSRVEGDTQIALVEVMKNFRPFAFLWDEVALRVR